MVSVLFVCLGNICRSPMAEGIFLHEIEKQKIAKHFKVDSAGTSGYHEGQDPHQGTLDILKKNNINYSELSKNGKSRKITLDDLKNYDYIIAMDKKNLEYLHNMDIEKKYHSKMHLILSFIDLELESVPDPYFSSNFEEVYSMLKDSVSSLIEKIKEDKNIK